MVKIILSLSIVLGLLNATQNFEDTCIKCHEIQDIPTEILYRRYLLKYSSKAKIKSAMIKYLKNPSLEKTIMPPRYISKFGLKKALKLSDTQLNSHVDELIGRYSIKKRLYIDFK